MKHESILLQLPIYIVIFLAEKYGVERHLLMKTIWGHPIRFGDNFLSKKERNLCGK